MKINFLILFLSICYLPIVAQQSDTIRGTCPVFIVYKIDDTPLKAYQMTEDCHKYCQAHAEEGRGNQQINLHYGYPADSVFWKPNRDAILEDYMHPVGLTDQYLEVDTIWVVMQNHFPIADRAYTRFRLADCYKYAENHERKVIKLPYYKRTQRSYERIMEIKRKRLGIKK